MEALDLENSRYMDDILIFALTRWKLRKAVRVMNQVFNELKPEPHPDKILIWKTVRNFKKHIDRLYEQGADLSRIGQYVKKWA